jgi:hypothetical protein
MLAPHSDVEHTDLLNILAGPDTPGAQNAGCHVVLNHHVTGPLVPGAERQVVMGPNGHIVLHYVALEFVPWVGSTAI